MKREDFKNITKEHIEICKRIIETGQCCEKQFGMCSPSCPFVNENRNTQALWCSDIIGSAKEFLEKFEFLTTPKSKATENLENEFQDVEILQKEISKLLEELEKTKDENKRLKKAIILIIGDVD